MVASIAFDDTARVWDLETGTALGPPLEGFTRMSEMHPCPAPALGQLDGSPTAVTAFSREVRIWDLTSMRPIAEPLCGVSRSLVSANIVPTSDRKMTVVTGSAEGVVRTHDLDDGRQTTAHIASAAQQVFDVATARLNGNNVLVRSSWMEADVWSLESHQRLGKRSGTSWRSCLSTVDDSAVVVSVADDFTLHAWDLHTQAPTCPPMAGHTAQVMALRAGTVGALRLAASASLDGTVRLWDLRTGEPFTQPIGDHDMGAYSVDFVHLDRDVIVSGAGDGSLLFWDVVGRCKASIELEPFPSAVQVIRVADFQGAMTLIAADRYGLMRIWDMHSASWTAELDIGSGINDVAADSSGRVCAATDMGAVVLSFNIDGPAIDRRSR
jgi:WD40 repeat protein